MFVIWIANHHVNEPAYFNLHLVNDKATPVVTVFQIFVFCCLFAPLNNLPVPAWLLLSFVLVIPVCKYIIIS